LQNNIAPWNEVAEKWKSTFLFRYKSLSEKEKHYSYFSDIPAIKSPLGFTLVCLKTFYKSGLPLPLGINC
jgi:hypothetical protein